MGFEQPEQEDALAAAPDAGHDFDESVALCADEPVKVEVALYCHGAHYTNSGWNESTTDSKKRCTVLFLWNDIFNVANVGVLVVGLLVVGWWFVG